MAISSRLNDKLINTSTYRTHLQFHVFICLTALCRLTELQDNYERNNAEVCRTLLLLHLLDRLSKTSVFVGGLKAET